MKAAYKRVTTRAVAVLGALLASVLAVSLAAGPATATPTPADPGSQQYPWATLRADITAHRIVIPAMRSTGYGRMTITGLTKLSSGLYKATWTLTNQDPRSPMSTASANSAENTALSTFCWPWDSGIGSSCWNNPATWDWNSIYTWIAPDPFSGLTYKREKACASGALGGVYTTVGKSAVGVYLGDKGLMKPSVGMFAIGEIVSCTVKVFQA